MSDFLSSIARTINYRYQSNLGMFQIGGAVSGLDTASIVEQILQVEGRPLQELNIKYEKLDLMKKAYSELDDKLEELRNLVFDLKLQSNVMKKTAESSDENVVQAQAYSSAVTGTYYIKVLQLATNSTVSGSEVVSGTVNSTTPVSDLDYYTTPTDSTVRIYNHSTGDYVDVDINMTDTIQDVVDKLNNALDSLFGAGAGSASFDESTGKLTIATSTGDTFAITQISGNFMEVFHLDETSGVGDSITGTASVWALNQEIKTLSDVANYKGETLNSGTIEINGVEIEVDSNDTIEEFLDKINSSDANVYAWYDYHTNKITIRHKEYGNNAITMDDVDSTGVFSVLGLDSSTFTPGQMAHLQISSDGVNYTDVYANENEGIEYEGISLTVRSVSTTPAVVRVNVDTEGIIDEMKNFVDKWNEIMDYIYEKLNEEPIEDKEWDEMSDEEKMKGILKGDEYLKSVFDRLKRFMTMQITEDEKFNYLFDIGISSGDIGGSYENMMKGKLQIDEDRLREIINNDLDDLWKFLGGNEEGFMNKLHDFLWNLTKFGGEIDQVVGVDGRIMREQRFLAKRISDWIMRLQKREQELWRKFSYMEDVISRLQAQSAWLSQITTQKK